MSGSILDTLVSPEFYESFDYYQAREDELLNLVREMVPDNWQFSKVNQIWFSCYPPEDPNRPWPHQGWKIHVSSKVASAQDILRAVVPVLNKNNVSFKFSLDLRILSLMNSKSWARQGAGKFITIYPVDTDQFVYLIEELHEATKQFNGPYVLSDKRYKDSRVLYYRYGGIKPDTVLNAKGGKTPMLTSPSGERVPDIRRPYFHVPEWTRDPFETSDTASDVSPTGITLKEGRYLIKFPLAYSNTGGVYVADDMETGKEVVIKEARPFVDSNEDTTSLLKKEHRILSKIAHARVAPEPLDFFQDWEHSFLVQERVSGMPLGNFSARNNVILFTHPTREITEKFYKEFKTIFLQLTKILKMLHENGIVFSDLSPNNVIVLPETLQVKILDFEGAHEIGVDEPVPLFTPGFAYADQMLGRASTFESDYFGLGAIMHFFLTPVNQIFLIHPKARYTFTDNITRDIGFPPTLCNLVKSLIDKTAENRPKPNEVIEILQRDEEVGVPNFASMGSEADPEFQSYVNGIAEYIISVADYERKDRLFPADSAIFKTNPLSLAHGACGVAYALKRMQNKVPEKVVDWILARNKNKALYPPGLYIGLAGIAWGMLELGLHKESQEVLLSTHDHRLLYDESDVFYGVAGWGLANLRFFMEFQDEIYLQKALEGGNFLLETLTEEESGCHWGSDEEIQLGYAYGASGISLFLLYLYLASGEERFLQTGIKALDFDISHATPNFEDGLSFKRTAKGGRNITYPYWIFGSAGVGTAVIRYYRLLGEERYLSLLESIYKDTNRKYAVFPNLFKGLSGLGEFLLDLYQLTNESRHLDAAYRAATGISLFKIEKKQGLAFPGDMLRRISCDYATGSAGIGCFLHRLVHKEEKGHFQLDQLLFNAPSERVTRVYQASA